MGNLVSLLLTSDNIPLITTIKEILDKEFEGQKFVLTLTPSKRLSEHKCLLVMLIGPVTISWKNGPTEHAVLEVLNKANTGVFNYNVMTNLNREVVRMEAT